MREAIRQPDIKTAHRRLVLCAHKTAVFHRLWDTDHEAGLNSVNWYFQGVYDGEIDHTLILFSGETWFQLIGCVSCQEGGFPRLIHKALLHNVMPDVWHAVITTRTIGPFFPLLIP
jgi:hypothetical protein